jgi:hypothetical protein
MNHTKVSHRDCAHSHNFERLEDRRLMSSVPVATLQAAGYAPIQWNGQQTFAKPGQFILSLNNVHGNGKLQIDQANKTLGALNKNFHATKFLGADGLLLLNTPTNLTHGEVQAALKGAPGFKYVEPNFALWSTSIPNDPSFSNEWGLNNTGQTGGTADADIDAPEAWDLTKGDGSVVVGVIDSGVDYTHPDLAGQIWTNPGEVAGDGIDNDGDGYIDDTRGWDFYSNDNNPMDENGHGTHVSGTIAGSIGNGTGVAGIVNAKIMPLRFLGPDGSGSTSGALAALNYATNMRTKYGVNIRVTNNSWGGGGYSQSMYDALQANNNAGELFIAAAGNGGPDQVGDNNDSVANYPSNYTNANVIAVAATDNRDTRASFSNYGATTVDLAAPGVSILSTYPNSQYAYLSGTSMATPHVSGVAALAFSYLPTATAAQVKSAILNGVDKISSMSGITVSGGRLNARKTLDQLTNPTPPPTQTTPIAPSTLTASALSGSQIRLNWKDNSSDETGFKIERSTNGSSWSQIATVGANATTYTATGLKKRTTYYFRVRAYNSAGNSAYTNTASTKTLTSGAVALASTTPTSVFSTSLIAQNDSDLLNTL